MVLVGTVMASNEVKDVIDQGEEAAKQTRNGIVDVMDPILHMPLAALGWSDKKITKFETAAANVVMFGGVVFGVYMIHRAFN